MGYVILGVLVFIVIVFYVELKYIIASKEVVDDFGIYRYDKKNKELKIMYYGDNALIIEGVSRKEADKILEGHNLTEVGI